MTDAVDRIGFMTKKYQICVLGGTGFVGFHVLHYLAAAGHHLKVLTRRRERHRDVLVLPTVDVIEADIHAPAALDEHFDGCDAVVNLVGILNEGRRPGTTFQAAHVDLPRHIVAACRARGVRRLLHMSALHADARHGASRYLRTKGEGEDVAHGAAQYDIRVTSFRPSVIFGPGDHFFNRFAALLQRIPLALPLAGPDTRYAPVFVEDVARVFCRSLDSRATYGRRYDLCGPRQYTLRQLVEYTARVTGRQRRVVGLGKTLSALQARVMSFVPGKPLTYDNYLSMQAGGVCRGVFPPVFEMTPTAVEAVVPYYLLGRNVRAQRYEAYRRAARHD